MSKTGIPEKVIGDILETTNWGKIASLVLLTVSAALMTYSVGKKKYQKIRNLGFRSYLMILG